MPGPFIGLGHQIYDACSKQSIDGWALVAFRKIPILIRGAPFIRMVGDKPAETFLKRSISSASNGRSFRIFDFDPGFRRTGAIRRIEFLSPLACDDTGD